MKSTHGFDNTLYYSVMKSEKNLQNIQLNALKSRISVRIHGIVFFPQSLVFSLTKNGWLHNGDPHWPESTINEIHIMHFMLLSSQTTSHRIGTAWCLVEPKRSFSPPFDWLPRALGDCRVPITSEKIRPNQWRRHHSCRQFACFFQFMRPTVMDELGPLSQQTKGPFRDRWWSPCPVNRSWPSEAFRTPRHLSESCDLR